MPGVTITTVQDAYVTSARPKKNTNRANRMYLTANSSIGLIFFSRTVPDDANITKAIVRLHNGGQWTTTTLSLQRVGRWTLDQVHFDNQPGTVGPTVSVSKTAPADGTLWEFDIRTMLQGVVDSGQEWFGLQIRSNTGRQWIYGAASNNEEMRISVEIEWSDRPDAPTELEPSNNAAYTIDRPMLRFDFTDVTGDNDMYSYQIQTSGTNAFSAPTYDSGWQVSETPSADLSALSPVWPVVAVGGSWWWRVRVQDLAGQVSDWSDPVQTRRVAKGSLALISPEPSQVLVNQFTNPSVEKVITGWSSASSLNSSRSGLAGSPDGSFVHRATVTTAFANASTLTLITRGLAQPGEPIGGRMRIRTSGATKTVQARIRSLTSDGIVNRGGLGLITLEIGPQWKEVSVSDVQIALGEGFRMEIIASTASPWEVGEFVETDSGILWSGIDPGSFFSGATPDTNDYDYEWTGDPENSASIRTSTEKKITDPTFPVVWDLAAATQAMYQVVIYNFESMDILYDSGRVTSTAESASIPKGIIQSTTDKYLLVVTVWDNVGRANLPNDLPFYQVRSVFMFKRTANIPPVLTLAVSRIPSSPAALLEFTQQTASDSIIVVRNGNVVASEVETGQLEIVNGKYRYRDYTAPSRQTHTWEVIRVVNGVASDNNPSATVAVKNKTAWLMDEDNNNQVPLANFVPEMDESEQSEVVFTQSGRGVLSTSTATPVAFGSVSAEIAGEMTAPISAEEAVRRVKIMRRQKNKKNRLAYADINVLGWAYNIRLTPNAQPNGTTDYFLTFDFVEDNE